MAEGNEPKPIPFKRIYHSFTGITGSANTNIYLSQDLKTDLSIADSDNIISIVPESDAAFAGSIYTIFRNSNSLYIKTTQAIANGTLYINFWVAE